MNREQAAKQIATLIEEAKSKISAAESLADEHGKITIL